MATVAPNSLPSKSESEEDLTFYNPQRVLMELGHNQGAIRILRDTGTSDPLVVEARIIGVGKNQF